MGLALLVLSTLAQNENVDHGGTYSCSWCEVDSPASVSFFPNVPGTPNGSLNGQLAALVLLEHACELPTTFRPRRDGCLIVAASFQLHISGRIENLSDVFWSSPFERARWVSQWPDKIDLVLRSDYAD